MRTLIDIPERDLLRLTRLGRSRKVSRAHLVRTAISQYLQGQGEDSLDTLFGIWADRKMDGVEYQEQMRREWERES